MRFRSLPLRATGPGSSMQARGVGGMGKCIRVGGVPMGGGDGTNFGHRDASANRRAGQAVWLEPALPRTPMAAERAGLGVSPTAANCNPPHPLPGHQGLSRRHPPPRQNEPRPGYGNPAHAAILNKAARKLLRQAPVLSPGPCFPLPRISGCYMLSIYAI